MKRSTIARWGIVVCLFCCVGCGTTRGSMVGSWWGGADKNDQLAKKSDEDKTTEKVASINPFKRNEKKKGDEKKPTTETASKETKPSETPAAAPADAKPAIDASATRLATHDAQTLKLIEEELKNATPQEREKLYNEWKPLDGALVKEIISIRRMMRQLEQSKQQQLASNPATPSSAAQTEIKIDPLQTHAAGAGHSVGQHTAGRTATSPLGASPWSQPGHESLQGFAQNASSITTPGNGFNVVPSGMAASDPRIIPASGMQQPGDAALVQNATYSTSPVPPAGVAGSGFAPAANGGLTIAPEARPNGQPGGIVPAGFTGSVSTNGGPQVAAGAGAQSGSVSPYYPPEQSPTAIPTGIVPVNAQSADLSQAAVTHAQAQSSASVPATAGAGPAQNSALAALGIGRLFNAGTAAVPAGGVPVASAAAAKWNDDLQRLITSAAADVAQTGPGTTDLEKQIYIEKHVYLRMLFLMAGQQVRAMEPIPGIDPADQEFWQQVFWGISSYFDSAAIPDPLDRATQTTLQLRGALTRLQEKARLELRNVNFCHKIASFGNYERFQRDEFSPGQPVLIYAEVSNFKSEQSADGPFRTLLKSTIEIYNTRGELIQSMPFPTTEDLCQNQRRDYFHSYEFTIPQKVAIGPHVMKLTVEDQISRKIATYSLNFSVR